MMVIAAASSAEIRKTAKEIRVQDQQMDCGTSFIKGDFMGREIVVVQTGVGPQRAKTAALALIKNFCPSFILLIGAGGAVDSLLKSGDIVIVKKILRKQGPLHNRLTMIADSFNCHEGLSQKAFLLIEQSGLSPVWGNCLTTEKFIHLQATKKWINQTFQVSVVEMESAAMAKIFSSAKIPFFAVRVISDTGKKNTLDYGGLISQKEKSGIPGIALHFIKRPHDIFRAARLIKDMTKVSSLILQIVKILAGGLPAHIQE